MYRSQNNSIICPLGASSKQGVAAFAETKRALKVEHRTIVSKNKQTER